MEEEEDETVVGTDRSVVSANVFDEVVAVSILAECRCLTPTVSALASGIKGIDPGASFWLSKPLYSSWVCVLSGMNSRWWLVSDEAEVSAVAAEDEEEVEEVEEDLEVEGGVGVGVDVLLASTIGWSPGGPNVPLCVSSPPPAGPVTTSSRGISSAKLGKKFEVSTCTSDPGNGPIIGPIPARLATATLPVDIKESQHN